MRASVLTVTGFTLIATTFGCAGSATTTSSSAKTTVGLNSLDGDTVFSAPTPDVGEGSVALAEQTIASSGLWMDTTEQPAATDAWPQKQSSFKRVYRLVIPPDPSAPPTEVASLRAERRTSKNQ